jgi:hypothetical protein
VFIVGLAGDKPNIKIILKTALVWPLYLVYVSGQIISSVIIAFNEIYKLIKSKIVNRKQVKAKEKIAENIKNTKM